MKKKIINLAMKKYKSFNKAGKALGITHRTVSLKCKKYNINQKFINSILIIKVSFLKIDLILI